MEHYTLPLVDVLQDYKPDMEYKGYLPDLFKGCSTSVLLYLKENDRVHNDLKGMIQDELRQRESTPILPISID